jgi:hypothetical protein
LGTGYVAVKNDDGNITLYDLFYFEKISLLDLAEIKIREEIDLMDFFQRSMGF